MGRPKKKPIMDSYHKIENIKSDIDKYLGRPKRIEEAKNLKLQVKELTDELSKLKKDFISIFSELQDLNNLFAGLKARNEPNI